MTTFPGDERLYWNFTKGVRPGAQYSVTVQSLPEIHGEGSEQSNAITKFVTAKGMKTQMYSVLCDLYLQYVSVLQFPLAMSSSVLLNALLVLHSVYSTSLEMNNY